MNIILFTSILIISELSFVVNQRNARSIRERIEVPTDYGCNIIEVVGVFELRDSFEEVVGLGILNVIILGVPMEMRTHE